MSFHSDQLKNFGWTEFFSSHFQKYAGHGYEPGRVVTEQKGLYRVVTSDGESAAKISGKFRHEALNRADFPSVGDWVVVRPDDEGTCATIHAILPRRSKFMRKTAGARMEEQIVATNIDTVILMMSVNQNYNPRRMERYLIVAWESGARPVIVLSKADLCSDVQSRISEMRRIARGVSVHAISVVEKRGLNELECYFRIGETVALVGSSGVGKSTLINHLLGYDMHRVQAIREEDDRGRHTTTHRELTLLPQGGLILDTPGMRELQLWNVDEGIDFTFADIEELSKQCHFRNCNHRNEPHCAVREALSNGELEGARFSNFQKLQKELRHLELKRYVVAQSRDRQRWKKLTRLAKERAHWKRR